MTGSAWLSLMGTFQGISCIDVVKWNLTPLLAVMTGIACILGIILFIQIWLMDILVAIGTFYSYLSEAPFIIFLMTGETGGGKVRSSKLKRAHIVLFNRKTGPVKSKGWMAFGAVGWFALH
jgi:hypothetical protein